MGLPGVDGLPGGGEFTLDVLGPVREPLACVVLPAFAARVGSAIASWRAEGGRCGVPAADKARCIAAADGTVGMLGPGALGVRWGLMSELFFLDRLAARVAAVMPAFANGRTGEPSREGLGEVVVEEVVELSRGVVEERLKVRGDDVEVCSDRLLRLEMESTRFSVAPLSFAS